MKTMIKFQPRINIAILRNYMLKQIAIGIFKYEENLTLEKGGKTLFHEYPCNPNLEVQIYGLIVGRHE